MTWAHSLEEWMVDHAAHPSGSIDHRLHISDTNKQRVQQLLTRISVTVEPH